MSRKSTACLAAILGLVVAGAAAADDVRSIRVGSRTVAIDSASPELTERLERLVTVQRSVRETLLAGALTPDQMSTTYQRLGDFAQAYGKAVRQNDPVVSQYTFEELFEAKAAPALRAFGLREETATSVRELVGSWVAEELALPDELLGQAIEGVEVRR